MTTQPTKVDMDLIRRQVAEAREVLRIRGLPPASTTEILEAMARLGRERGMTAYEAALDRADDARREQKERGA